MRLLRAAAWFGVLVVSAGQSFPQAPFAFTCADNARVESAKKNTIDSLAVSFIQTVLGPRPSAAFDMMSRAGQAEMARDQIDGVAAGIVRQFQPENLALQHTYLIDLRGKSPAGGWFVPSICPNLKVWGITRGGGRS